MPQVNLFLWDDTNEFKVHAHGLSADEVDAVLESRFAVFRNRNGMRGAYQVVGRNLQGRYVTVIIEPTSFGHEVWRVVTAWPSKQSETTKARGQGV